MTGRTARRRVTRISVDPAGVSERADLLAAEEPLGIRIDGQAVSLTMRTPGDDVDLAAGFLISEGIVRTAADIASIKICDGQQCGHPHDPARAGCHRQHRRCHAAAGPGGAARAPAWLPDQQRLRSLREDQYRRAPRSRPI